MKTTVAKAKKWAALSGLLYVSFFISTAFAGAIFVANASFETLPSGGLPIGCGSDCSYSIATTAMPIPGWVASGGENTEVGQFQPGTNSGNFLYFNSIPDGSTVAYSNGGSISQKVGQTVELGIVYTLQVDLGLRNDNPDPGLVELVIGKNAPIVATPETTTPPKGGWSNYIATYTGLSTDVGDSITIELSSPGIQGDWDNVRLDSAAAAVPEPGTLPLIGAALLVLVGVVRNQRVRGDLFRHAVSGISKGRSQRKA